MRCPKCSYITFDHLEICPKCRKNIAAVSEQLSGTVFQADAPAFLQFEVAPPDLDGDIAVDDFSKGDDVEFDMSVEGEEVPAADEVEIDLLDDEVVPPVAAVDDEDDFDLPLSGDETFDLDLDEPEEGDTDVDAGPQLDFSELDISDLAPPADELPSGELTLEDTPAAPAASRAGSAPAMGGSGGGLEDLQMEGLDLDIPSLPPAGSAAGGNMRPAVKTGTALDDFDIDLGDLTSGQKE
jgi:hypothetical protein